MDENKKKIVIDSFLNGDVNKDGKVNIADMTTLIDKLLSGDGDVKVTDLTDLIDYLLSAENSIKEYDIDGNGEFNTDDVKALIGQILNA